MKKGTTYVCRMCGKRHIFLGGPSASPSSATHDDKIHHPKHYTQGIECWDYIISHDMGYLEGNVIKYVTRYKHKDGLDDLLKAKAYLDRLIVTTQEAKP